MSQDLREREETEEEERGPRFSPLAYPLFALVFGGILVWSFSRILLALSPHAAVAVATLAALNILIGAALVAYGPRVRRRPAALPLLVASGVAVVAAGVVMATVVGERSPAEEEAAGGEKGGPAQSVSLAAKDLKFVETKLQFNAGSRVSLRFSNQDRGIPHNFVLFRGKDASAPEIFSGQVISGPAETTYSFTAPGPGEYFFHCEVHPQTMTGTAAVGGEGGAEGGATEGQGETTVGAVPLTAKNLAFSPKQLTVPAGGQVSVKFTNSDAGIPHNFAVYQDQSATKEIFKGEAFPGPATKDMQFKAPPPGSYFFRCDIHPTQMTGTLVVT